MKNNDAYRWNNDVSLSSSNQQISNEEIMVVYWCVILNMAGCEVPELNAHCMGNSSKKMRDFPASQVLLSEGTRGYSFFMP
jgi:hypothetical protein